MLIGTPTPLLLLSLKDTSKNVWKSINVAKLAHDRLAVRTDFDRISIYNRPHLANYRSIVQLALLYQILWNLLLDILESLLHHLFNIPHHLIDVWEPRSKTPSPTKPFVKR